MHGKPGPRRGVTQRGNPPQYVVGSGHTWRPNPTLEPAQAVTLFKVMKARETSASGVINDLLALVDFDEETGMPVWADTGESIWPVTADITQGTLVDLTTEHSTDQRAA